MFPVQGAWVQSLVRELDPHATTKCNQIKKEKMEKKKKKTTSGSDTGYGKIRENATVGCYLREVVRVTWERESAMERAARTRSQSTC